MADEKLRAYMTCVIDSLTDSRDEVKQALAMIASTLGNKGDPLPLQLLALRRYLRIGGKKVEANWSWSEQEARARRTQEPTRTLYAEADKVKEAFAGNNAGYKLSVSPVRSLERQVKLWNDNTTVQKAGARLQQDMTKELNLVSYPELPSGQAIATFTSKLQRAAVSPEPSNAAPGTSDHGRGTAVDFVIMRGATVIASTVTSHIATRWKADGWEAKLIAACRGTRLQGPLQMPYEPWHWVLGS